MDNRYSFVVPAAGAHCLGVLQNSRIGLAVALMIFSGLGAASGFRVPGSFSIAGLGTADALVANQDEAGALAYNPAAMSFHDRRILVAGLIAVDPQSRVKPEGVSNTRRDDPDSPILVPNLYVMTPVTGGWSLGLSVNSPFGLETNWEQGTFPAFTGPLASLEPEKTRLDMVNINPNVAYRLNRHASAAIGIDYYYVDEATSDTQQVELTGDGSDFGWNAAFMYVIEDWSFGLSYRSSVDVEVDGEFDARQVLGFKVDSRTELNFPDFIQMGVRYQASPRLAVEFDIERTNWSKFYHISVQSRDNIAALGISRGTELTNTTNNWRDANSYHLAITFNTNERTQLRAGYTLNENPQRQSYFSPRYPNSRRHVFTAGLKQVLSGWDIEGGAMYARWNDRDVENTTPFIGGDANGTDVYNGEYKLDGFIFGLGINAYF